MEDNKTRVLYDRLTQDGYDIGDFDSFSKNVQDEAKRKSLYETITNDGYDVGDFDSFSSKLVARSQKEPVTNVTNQNVQPEQPQVQPVQDMPSYDPKTQGYILDNVPDMFRSKGNNLATRPLPQQDLFENNPSDLVRKIGIDQQQRVEQAQKSANDPYMKEQNLELFKRQNQEQINSVNELINAARQERAKERQRRVRSVGDGGIFSTMSQAYLAGEQNDTDKQLEYASTLMEQAQNITNEAKKKGNTNFFAGFARGFKDAPLDGWAMGLQDLKNYSAAKKVMDKVDKGEELTPSEDALMQALVTNAATQMYYSGDLGRGYKAGGVTAESLPFMLDMIAGMGAVQALTKPASKAIVKYAADKAAQMGLGRATIGLAKGAARTVAGLGDVAAHTATFGSARVAADYQRRGLGDVQVKPNADGTVSYGGRENVQTGAEALGKSIISTAAETGSELLGEYFAPMLGYIGRVTGADKVGKIIPASVGKAFKDVVNSQGFRKMQEIAKRAKISGPLGEYAEEVANNLVSTAIGDMTPEQLVDLDQNIDTFLGVAPMSALFGAAGTGGYLRDKYKNYRNMRNFETQMQDAMGEDWSGVREALQDADIETARNMVKDVLSSLMSPDMKKNAIKYISSVLQEQTLQEADKQMMPEEIAFEKRNIIHNLNYTRSKISLNDEELNAIINSEEGYQAIISQFDPETANNIMKYKQAYDDFVNYNYWVQDQADNARRQAEAQVESLTNATTGTIMRVNNKLTKNPVNVLRGNLVFDNEGKVDENQSDKTIYYMSEDGRVKMAPVSMFSSLVDNTPAEEMIQRAGNDAQEEVLQAEEAQINSIPAQEQQPIGPETRFTMGGNNYEVNRVTPDGYEVYLLDENGTPAQSHLMSEEEIRNAINGQQPANAEETQPSVPEHPVQEETSEQPVQENQTAMSRIPLNERGEQDFEAAPVADTSAALLEISDNVDDAKDTATQMIDHYNNELKKAEKAKSTGNTIQEIVKMKQEKKANIKAINDKISYWNQVTADLEAKRPTGLIAQAEEKAKENQQRLASMTAEEQQAAQQEVQKKIDAGDFERKEPRKKVRYVKEDADLGPSITPQEHVLREIATGRVSFSLSDTEGAQGLSSHLGYSNSPEERKKLVWALSSDGLTPEAAAEQIHADMPENLQGMVTDQDVFNMIINAFQEYGSPSKMWDAAKNMHGTDIEENIPGYEEDQERQLIEWEASENRMSVPEWIAYSDYIEEELNNLYSSVTDEELNTIFEQIINDYERRAETESTGSTEGQTDSEQGNTVQPERESDNEGRTGEVEEQPEPANETDGESGIVVPEPEGTVAHNVEIMSDQVTNNDLKIVHDAVGKTFRSKNGDLMTIENYRTNWDEREKLHGVTYNFNGDVRNTSQKLGLPVEIIHSIDEVPEGSAKEAIKKGRKVKGWYSLEENKVYVYLPNATSMEDVNQTILHEGVAHYGLRQLVGEDRMDDFLDDVFANVTDEVRKKIIDTLPRYGYNSRIATEEYMARMAENGVDVSVWQRIKQAFNSLTRRMGINIKISDNELRHILWRSRQNLDKNKPLDLAKDVAMQYQMGVGNYFREDTDGSIGMYEQSLKGWKYKAQEAYQDSMLALKNLQEVIAKVSGKPIKSFENAYMAENQLSSKNTSEAEVYYKKHYQPMLQEAGKMMKKYDLTQKGIERYMMLAHGIERNVELTFREQLDEVIKNNPDDADQFIQDFKDEKERLRKLYSGYEYLKELSDYIGGVNDYSATQAILNSMDGEEHDNFQEDALNYVKYFEQTYDVKELWNKTNDATKTTLRKGYDSGMMGKEQYSNVNNMYMYYVPLRGWDEQTAEDVYEYIDSERNPVSSVLKSAKGRKSIPDEIFATIGNMAESAIMQGNRNMMKQSFMSMVINHPTDIATLKKAWYVYDPVKDEWNISMPDIQESDNAETIAEKLKNHEEQMKQLKENGLATQKPNGLNINYRINKNNISQHVVQVKNGGKDYVIYINGNPRAAQAINGLTNPNVEQNPIFRSIATANRWLAANFTTRNPAFVLSNLVRDLIFSNVAVSIKEDGKYSSRFRKNILKAMPVVLRNLNGKPNNTEADRYFQEFIENGGETGYMHLNDVEKYKKKVRKELSKINGEMGSAKMAMDFAIDRLEDLNRWAEDISRFTTYMTSRQMGRSITESVNDAKEVTVNFNKKGAGYKTGGFFGITSGIFRNLYLFFNASVQSLTNFKRLYDKQPVKFYSALGGFMSAGFLMPMINSVLYSIFGGGDDDPYNDLPEWVRRNNLCIYTGNDTFLTIPLPIELRAFYGLGDYAYQLTTGKEKPSATNIAKGTVGQLADLLPLNPTGNKGLKTFMPDIMSPIFEAYVWNKDFTGKPVAKISPFNERDPEWKRVYKGTSGWLVDTSKFLNDISNGSGPGSEFRKGSIDFNPAKVEHLLESYFGGMAKTFNQAGKTIYYGGKSLIEQQKDEDLVMRNVPIVNRFLNTVDERNAFYGINTEYFNLRDEMDQFKYELNGVKKSGNKDEYKEMLNSDLYDKYQKYKPYQKKLKKLNDMAKESQGEDRKEIEDMIIETRRELLEEVK